MLKINIFRIDLLNELFILVPSTESKVEGSRKLLEMHLKTSLPSQDLITKVH